MNVTAVVAEKVLEFKMLANTLVNFTESVVEISAHSLSHNFTVYHREILLDLFFRKYQGQKILVDCLDFESEHLRYNGFWNFLESLTDKFSIPKKKVLIRTTNKYFLTPFRHKIIPLGIFTMAHQWLKDSEDNLPGPEFTKPLDSDARLLGGSFGRFCIPRLRLMYELDQVFSSDNLLLIYKSSYEVENHLTYLKCTDQYQKELDWVRHRVFDQDDTDMSDIDQDRYNNKDNNYLYHCSDNTWHMRYHKLWPKFHVEIVAETDVFTSCVFTGKTARCLATGKPFVLLAAPNSLATLRDMGFVTFGDIIDESYDQQLSFNDRINSMIQSLQNLNNSGKRNKLLKKLRERATENIKHYQSFVMNQSRVGSN
jgi:hypothetical protein